MQNKSYNIAFPSATRSGHLTMTYVHITSPARAQVYTRDVHHPPARPVRASEQVTTTNLAGRSSPGYTREAESVAEQLWREEVVPLPTCSLCCSVRAREEGVQPSPLWEKLLLLFLFIYLFSLKGHFVVFSWYLCGLFLMLLLCCLSSECLMKCDEFFWEHLWNLFTSPGRKLTETRYIFSERHVTELDILQ